MEPICWLGLAGIAGITAALCGIFSKSCKNSGSTCDCASKKDTAQGKESSAPVSGIDDKKEKAINDLIK